MIETRNPNRLDREIRIMQVIGIATVIVNEGGIDRDRDKDLVQLLSEATRVVAGVAAEQTASFPPW